MKISVIGIGYVGLVSAVCFSKLGHKVIGVDKDEQKIASIKLGKNPLPRVQNLEHHLKKAPFEVLLNNHKKAIKETDISFVCVETPTKKNGSINLIPLKKVCKVLGRAIKNKPYHLVVIRSTIFPGSIEILKKEIEKSSGKVCGKDFDVTTNPEFLRELNAIEDFFNPSYIVVGADKKEVGQKVMDCYKKINCKKFIVDSGVAQMIKYANNSWHGCKVAFTNEIGKVCDNVGVDKYKLMGLFCEDTRLNINKYYHKPGKAFEGHCIPKDLAVLQSNSKRLKIKNPLINSISRSNDVQKNIDSHSKLNVPISKGTNKEV